MTPKREDFAHLWILSGATARGCQHGCYDWRDTNVCWPRVVAALAERDALRADKRNLIGELVKLQEADRGAWQWKYVEAEARAERARRDAIEECIAAVHHSYDEPVGIGLVLDALAALLAPEAQRPAKEGE